MLNKKIFFIFVFFAFFSTCKNKPTVIETKLAPAPNTKPQANLTEPGIFYAGSFRVQNSSAYQTLLEACKRCGTRRLYPGGGYERFYVQDSSPKKCRNWSGTGFLQIHFQGKGLVPSTKAIVSIQPQYTGTNPRYANQWGEPFSVTTTANAINESQGFEILIHPSPHGLGGIRSLIIRSDHSNHVNNDELNVQVIYGQKESETIISGTIVRQKGRSVKKALFNCDTYTN